MRIDMNSLFLDLRLAFRQLHKSPLLSGSRFGHRFVAQPRRVSAQGFAPFRIALNHCQADVVQKGTTVREVLYGGEEHHERGLSGRLFGLVAMPPLTGPIRTLLLKCCGIRVRHRSMRQACRRVRASARLIGTPHLRSHPAAGRLSRADQFVHPREAVSAGSGRHCSR